MDGLAGWDEEGDFNFWEEELPSCDEESRVGREEGGWVEGGWVEREWVEGGLVSTEGLVSLASTNSSCVSLPSLFFNTATPLLKCYFSMSSVEIHVTLTTPPT